MLASVLQSASSCGRQLTSSLAYWRPVRRCELEPDYNLRFETIRPVRKRSGVSLIHMGKKSRRDRAAYGPLRPPGSQTVGQMARGSRRGTTAGRFDDNVQPARNEPSAQPKPTVAEAEAELRAAIAAIPPSPDGSVEVATDPRSMRAMVGLQEAVTLDEDDKANFREYLRHFHYKLKIEGRRLGSRQQLIKTMNRWPRIRKYWPRLRRRVCWACGKQYDLSEPRLWVCGGGGDARYCDETCQAAHWLAHRSKCFEKFFENVKKRRAQGESAARIRQEFLEWYGISIREDQL